MRLEAAESCQFTKTVFEDLQRKRNDLYLATGTSALIHLTMVTPAGIVQNSYAKEIQSEVVMNDLFAF